MAYIPTEWATGDVITAEKLNKAEEGIAAANPYIIPITWEGSVATLAASYNDIKAHKASIVVAQEEVTGDSESITDYYLGVCYVESGKYYATFIGFEAGGQALAVMEFEASADDAPLTFTVQ